MLPRPEVRGSTPEVLGVADGLREVVGETEGLRDEEAEDRREEEGWVEGGIAGHWIQ